MKNFQLNFLNVFQYIFRELEGYEGAQAQTKLYIQNPGNDEFKKECWESLLPLVTKMKKFWKFSFDLSTSYTELIAELTSDTENATKVRFSNAHFYAVKKAI